MNLESNYEWTKELPNRPGWYWSKFLPSYTPIVIHFQSGLSGLVDFNSMHKLEWLMKKYPDATWCYIPEPLPE
jgi:hypothetical protein